MATDDVRFFDELRKFSERYAKHAGMVSSLSPWGYEDYNGEVPIGAIIHYTADEDFHRVLRWFLREKYQSKSSSNVVVADCRMPKHAECAKGLPLMEELPATIVQCRPFNKPSWHATWTNRFTYGIENVCAGELRTEQGDFFTWRPRDKSASDWTMPWEPKVQKTAVPMHGRWWSPYLPGQIKANVIVLRHLQGIYGTLKRPWILGHDAVQGTKTGRRPTDKRDPGPTYPIHGVREAVFDDWTPLLQKEWFQHFSLGPLNGQVWRENAIIDWVRWLAEDLELYPDPEVATARLQSHLLTWKDAGPFEVTGKTALHLLGYHLTSRLDSDLDSDEIQTIRIFQRMMGLQEDGDPGPKTRAAIIERLEDRGILDPLILA
jgi:N-acetyl-anhydromuramyl-L-alanine amidase AmpD